MASRRSPLSGSAASTGPPDQSVSSLSGSRSCRDAPEDHRAEPPVAERQGLVPVCRRLFQPDYV